ncbi:MAG: tryptophan--tRNA ligase [Patescibacteria group bacterium]
MSSEKKRLLSGVKPTGKLHVGNYFGAMKQFVDLQDEFESFIFVADIHSLNRLQHLGADNNARQEQLDNTFHVICGYLAIGIDPEKTVLFKQSDVLAHPYVGWIFNALTSMPYLMRAHAFKDAEAKSKEISVGTFVYPMLMASDILLYDPDVVPVGKDQKQHIEYARDTAQKFNRIFGDTFKLPEEKIIDSVESVPGLDGQKMSKSYFNTLPLFADKEDTKKLIMSAAMDSKDINETKNPDDYPIYKIYKLFASEEENNAMRANFENGGVGYGEIKQEIAEKINNELQPMRDRYNEFSNNPDLVTKILKDGADKANAVANQKLEIIKDRVGLQ